jgi:hypothetical protein
MSKRHWRALYRRYLFSYSFEAIRPSEKWTHYIR